MPTHGRRGLERFLLGSVTERVVRVCDAPVLTVRPDEQAIQYPYREVLVATDGSRPANAALERGIDAAGASGARLHVLSVVDTTSLGMDVYSGVELDRLEEHATEVLEEATAAAREASVDVVAETAYGSSIYRKVHAYAEEHDVDLVVVGTHGRTGFDRYLLGSVAEKLVRTSPVPVLTVRGEPGEG
jgi:nucleotide-binding universal stress UspA family protein